MKKTLLLSALAIGLLTSCSKDPISNTNTNNPTSCEIAIPKQNSMKIGSDIFDNAGFYRNNSINGEKYIYFYANQLSTNLRAEGAIQFDPATNLVQTFWIEVKDGTTFKYYANSQEQTTINPNFIKELKLTQVCINSSVVKGIIYHLSGETFGYINGDKSKKINVSYNFKTTK
jgi:prolyl oligopeptidase PreP (S9A serine peptidase family)